MGTKVSSIIKQFLNPNILEETVDDLRIINSYSEYNDKTKKLDFFIYEYEVIDRDGSVKHLFKAIKMLKIIKLPDMLKASQSMMDIQEQVMAAFWEHNINFVSIIARMENTGDDKPLGLMQMYGVQGVANDLFNAKRIAVADFQGIISAIKGSFRTLEFGLLEKIEAEWLKEKMTDMKHLQVVRGLPLARKSGAESSAKKGLNAQDSDTKSEETSEQFAIGLSGHDFIALTMATPVAYPVLENWLMQTSKKQTAWASIMQGTTSLNAGISLPVVFAANLGSSLGSSDGVSDSTSTGTSTSYGTSYGESQSYSESRGITEGYSTSHGITSGYSVTNGISNSISESFSRSASISHTDSSSLGSSISVSEGTSFGYSQNYGVSSNQGLSISESFGQNTSFGQSMSASQSSSHSQSIGDSASYGEGTSSGYGNNTSNGVTNTNTAGGGWNVAVRNNQESASSGVNQSGGTSANFGASNNYSEGKSSSESWSNSASMSQGASMSKGQSQSSGYGQSWGLSYSGSEGTSWGSSLSQSIGNTASISSSDGWSEGISYGISRGTTYSQSVGESYSESVSESKTESVSASQSQGIGFSRGESYGKGESWGRSIGTSSATSQSSSTGTSASMGISASLSLGKSYQFIDSEVQNIVELFEYQKIRLKEMLHGGNGAFFVDMYIATEDLEGKNAAATAAKFAWYNPDAYVCPLQVLDFDEDTEKYLLYHFNAFSPSVVKERDSQNMFECYKYTTILTSKELSAYTHLIRVSDGGIYADVQNIPELSVPANLKGEVYIGKLVSGHKWDMERGYLTVFDYRIESQGLMHALFAGGSRSGKTVAALRFVAEIANHIKRGKEKKRMRILALDPKKDWRGLARFVEPERFRIYSMGDPNRFPFKFNPLKVPYGVDPEFHLDTLIDVFCRSYGLGIRSVTILLDTFKTLYDKKGVFDTTDPIEISKRSGNITMEHAYNLLLEKKEGYSRDKQEAVDKVLDRLQRYAWKNGVLFKLYCQPDGMSIDEVLGADDVIVLESGKLQSNNMTFIFGLITAEIYMYAKYCPDNFLGKDQFETLLVVEEANRVLTGNDSAGGSGDSSSGGIQGQSIFEEMLDQAAGLGIFVVSITQKPSAMPSSVLANSGLLFSGRMTIDDDIDCMLVAQGKGSKMFNNEFKTFIPKCPTGWFICKSSRTFDYKESEPMLVSVDRLDFTTPTDEELDEMMLMKELSAVDTNSYLYQQNIFG